MTLPPEPAEVKAKAKAKPNTMPCPHCGITAYLFAKPGHVHDGKYCCDVCGPTDGSRD